MIFIAFVFDFLTLFAIQKILSSPWLFYLATHDRWCTLDIANRENLKMLQKYEMIFKFGFYKTYSVSVTFHLSSIVSSFIHSVVCLVSQLLLQFFGRYHHLKTIKSVYSSSFLLLVFVICCSFSVQRILVRFSCDTQCRRWIFFSITRWHYYYERYY